MPRLVCEYCDEPVTPHNGWFAWFTRRDADGPGLGTVVGCAVTCNFPRHCNDVIERRFTNRGCHEWDHHLSRFTGIENLPTTLGLIADYVWEPEALRKFLDYIPRFVAAGPG